MKERRVWVGGWGRDGEGCSAFFASPLSRPLKNARTVLSLADSLKEQLLLRRAF